MRIDAAKTDRKIYTLSDFRGVDYSLSPLEVKPYRATDMANLLLKDGVLHKRKGWEQLIKMPSYDTPTDIYSFGNVIIVRCLSESKEGSVYYSVDLNNEHVTEVARTKGNAKHAMVYEYKGSLFVSDGTYHKLCYGETGSLKSVLLDKSYGEWITAADGFLELTPDAPYVPTTTINITSLDASESIINAYPRTRNEALNLLSGWRKNRLIYENPTQVRRYKLDGSPFTSFDLNNDEEFSLKRRPVLMMQKGDEKKQFIFNAAVEAIGNTGYLYWRCKVSDCYNESGEGVEAVELCLGKYNTLAKRGVLGLTEDESISAGSNQDIGFLIIPKDFRPWKKEDTWDYDDIIMTLVYFNDHDIQRVALNYVIKQEELFSHNMPSIGILHGVSGANDRLFLAGGSETSKHTVFYSENEDLTYFPASQQLICGDTNSAISALERLSDGSLAVFKDVSSLKETSVYYITGQSVSMGAGLEGNEYYADLFTVSGGTINENGVSAHSTISYDGDSLFSSKDGVYAVVLSDNINSKERYARERSRPIATKLKEHDLTNAAAVVFDDQYWLSVGDGSGEVYVADSKYKYSTENTQTNSYNYEWFRLTNIPAVSFIERGNELYFLSADGWICKFQDGYTDIYKITSGDGNLAVATLSDGKRVVIFNGELYELIKSAAYAVDDASVQWEIMNIRTEILDGEEINVFDLPEYSEVEDGAIGLKFHVAVKSYWTSSVMNLGSSIYRKNLWAISASATPTSKGKINIGYKTRRENVLEGINAFNFGDVDFSMFTFDCGGFVNAFRQRIFERGLVYMQLMYSSDSVGDSVVHELSVEYAVTNKNIGIG